MKTKKAITLVEILLYLALFGGIFLAIMQFYLGVTRANQYSNEEISLFNDMIFLQSHLETTANQKLSVDTDLSTLNTDSSVLSLITPSGSIQYYLQAGNIFVNRDAQVTQLNSENTVITKFRVESVRIETNIVALKVTIELNGLGTNITRQSSFTLEL